MIEQLYSKATIVEENHTLSWDGKIVKENYITHCDHHKFAELIIAECAEVISSLTTLEPSDEYREGFFDAKKLIFFRLKDHFKS